MSDWLTAKELAEAGLPGLPGTKRGVADLAARERWGQATDDDGRALARPRRSRGGGTEYHLSLLPEAARAALAKARAAKPVVPRPDRESAWMRYDRLPAGMKARAEARLEAVQAIETLMRGGLGKAAAVEAVAGQGRRIAKATGDKAPSVSTLYEWFALVEGVAVADRLAYLAPAYVGRVSSAEIPAELYDLYKADWLRPERPTHSACYRRLERIAADRGLPLPGARTLQRRLEAEISRDLIVSKRGGADALNHAFPHMTRDRSGLAPLQIVNLDGHKWDNQVVWPDGTKGRPQCLVVQDVASGKILACRFDRTLNHHLVRLALSDVFRAHGLPETVIMDNGRENAAADIAGGQTSCWRWAREEQPAGLLKRLGIRAHFAKPYWGQAKPIERAFGEFARDIARHPAFAGAYTGPNVVEKPANYDSRAIPIAEFEALVRAEIEVLNAQRGRRGIGMNGRSFDEAFAEGAARVGLRRATEEQLRMAMLSSRPVLMDARENTVALHGGRYWSPELARLRRQRVIVRFDPDHLDWPVHVYSMDERYLCAASRVAAGSFDRVADGQAHGKQLAAWRRSVRDAEKKAIRLGAADVAAALPRPAPVQPAAAIPADSKIVRPAFGAPTRPEQAGQTPDFSVAWARSAGSASGGG